MLKIFSLIVTLIAIALITKFLYDFVEQPRMSNSGYIKIWTTEEKNVLRTIEDPELITELQSHWSNKETTALTNEVHFDYLIDGLLQDRLQYSSSGYLRVLSVLDAVPVYKLSEPESFNNLLLSEDK